MNAAALVLLLCGALAQAPRDLPAPATGTASIAGTLMSDTQPPRPVRRAMVSVNSSDRTVGRSAVTDDSGRFVIGGLPAGRYSISATRRGWVTSNYGAKAIGRPGSTLSLTEGQRATPTMRMARGAVITGTVLDQNGQPPAGLGVRVLQYGYVFNTGERRLNAVSASGADVDERGNYRVYGLAPGEYYVTAQAIMNFGVTGRDLHLTSDVDVQQAARAIQDGPSAPAIDVPQRTIGLAPVYYPGTSSVAQATPVTLRAGEERAGIDFTMQYVSAVRVDGKISAAGGPAPAGSQVSLIVSDPSVPILGFEAIRNARTSADGTFFFSEITPGSYILAVRAAIPSGDDGAAARSRWMWANTEVDVTGEDIHDLSVALQDSLTVAGTVQFESAAGKPAPPPATVRVILQPEQSSGPTISTGSVTLGADGRFTIPGVSPGSYRLGATIVSAPITWTVRSATAGGQESTQEAIDIRQSIDDAAIILSDRVAELTGHVQGAGAGDYSVIVFPVNRAQWSTRSGRVMATRAASDGTFVFKNVRPGDYQIAAVADVEPGEWYDPAYLQRLAPAALPITIAEGEKKVQDIKTGGG